MTTTERTPAAQGTGTYADVDGIHLYYEIHGTGRPVVLLHGGLRSGETFGPPAAGARRRATRSSCPTSRATAGQPTSTGRSIRA